MEGSCSKGQSLQRAVVPVEEEEEEEYLYHSNARTRSEVSFHIFRLQQIRHGVTFQLRLDSSLCCELP
jgi:hypothetical protein